VNKPPPQNIDSERQVLGAILINADSINDVGQFLIPEHFYLAGHQHIYKAMQELSVEEQPIDIVTIADRLDKASQLINAGGMAYLAELARDCISNGDLEYHGKIVVECWQLRELVKLGENLRLYAQKHSKSPDIIIPRFQAALEKIENSQEVAEWEYLEDIWDRLSPEIKTGKTPIVSKSFYPDLDRKILGFEKKTLTILGARPSVGKSAFGLQLAIKHIQHNLPVTLFTLEMDKDTITNRIISNLSKVPLKAIRKAAMGICQLPELELKKIDMARSKVNIGMLSVLDVTTINALQIRTHLKTQARKRLPALVVVDYLNLMDSHTKKEKRAYEIAEIVKSLHQTAKSLQVPIILICQINRENEKIQDTRPQLHNLKESGAIEEHSDMVILLHRPTLKNERSEDDSVSSSLTEIIIAKQRNGEVGTVRMNFLLEYQRFEQMDMSERYELPNQNYTGD